MRALPLRRPPVTRSWPSPISSSRSTAAASPQVTFAERAIDVTLRDGRDDADDRAARIPGRQLLVHHRPGRDATCASTSQPTPEPAALSYGAIVTAAAFFALLGFTVYRTTAGPHSTTPAGRASPNAGDRSITFQDVAGVDEAKDEVKEIVDFLREPERFSAIGGRIPKGVLLVGPPGTGKTLLARSIAGEADVPFLFASGSDFVEMYAGVGASRIRKLFKDARRHPSCIIFIDELDAVGRSRGGNSLSHEEREQTLNQLLVEMDGFAPNQGIVVDRRDQPAGHPRSGAAAARAASIGR